MTGSKQTATRTNQTESAGEKMVHLVKVFKVNKMLNNYVQPE